MKESVLVPDKLLKSAELAGHFKESFAYAKTLKPKPTHRKKAKVKS